MMHEPYDPRDRQITPRTQVVAWLVFALLVGSVAATDALNSEAGSGS